jgi:hypothetical protein
LAARTTGIPAKSNERMVGPNFHLEKIIPRVTDKIIAKNISGRAICGRIHLAICHDKTRTPTKDHGCFCNAFPYINRFIGDFGPVINKDN